jgi:Holliday junction resolvasome RuvABC endonuclease subunit
MGKKYIYAFDLSMSCSGISIFDENGNPVKVCSVATNIKDSTGARLKSIATFIMDLMEKYPASTIVLERAFSRFNNATAALYKVHGIVQLLFWDIPQVYYTPKDIKCTILKGNATKTQIQEKLQEKFPDIDFTNEDESDSFSVGISYFMKNNLIEKWK